MDFREHIINQGWSATDKIHLLHEMWRIRRFEQRALKTYQLGEMGGWLLLGIGQESVAAGVRSLLGRNDHTISGPRGLGHAIAAGMPMGPCMAELMGRKNGCSKGKGGMFSLYDPSLHHWGCHGIAAAQTPLAAGLGFGLKQRGVPGAVVCFLGDGAVNQGVYHESLNLAGLFGLPVVYVIENNGYAMGSSMEKSSRFTGCLARRAETYGIHWDKFCDQDIYELRVKVWQALERARDESRPTVLEIDTYRYYGFSVSDANHKKYRTVEEIEAHRARDPLVGWESHLIDAGVISEADAQEIREKAAVEADAAIKFGLNGTLPTSADLTRDVYWETDHSTPASRIGRHFFDD